MTSRLAKPAVILLVLFMAIQSDRNWNPNVSVAKEVQARTLALQSKGQPLLQPDSPEMNQRAPEVSHVRLETTKGTIRLEMKRAWSPHGVDRFYNLARHGYYDNTAIFRSEHSGRSASPVKRSRHHGLRVQGSQRPDHPGLH